MSSGKSQYLENKILNYLFNGTAYSSPSASLYAALYTVAPTATTSGTEVTGANGYARVQCSSFTTSTTGTLSNSSAIVFPTATANYPAAVVAAAICDASSGGNILYWGTLTSVTVNSGNTFEFLANGFTVNEA